MKAGAKEAAPALAAIILNDESSREDVDQAAGILRKLGPEARAVVPTLEKALPNQDKYTQQVIADILKAIKQN